MKNEVRLALLCLAASAAPAFAQTSPQCTGNYDASRNAYVIMNPAAGAVNQQCFITVYPTGITPAMARQYPSSYLIEGSYAIELSGGGGGGGGGALKDGGGGGGGAGAAPSRSTRFLAPGEYKLTIGTGGAGGTDNKTRSLNGNPTNIVNASTGQLIAGFPGADRALATSSSGNGAGGGGVGSAGGSTGGSGGDSGMKSEEAAQAGGTSLSRGTSSGGQAGSESGRTARTSDGRTVQANAGGGGGAGVGSGGQGASVGSTGSSAGSLGGGGGGGSGGVRNADMGSRGGNGFIRLSLVALAPQAPQAPQAAAPSTVTIIQAAPVIQKYSLSSDALFGFGKTTLRPEGEAKLDELVAKLKTVDIDTILSTGHTDRIGSSDLNQRLSIDRAEVVKAYLVSKGVQSYRNAAVGMGESQPMTSTSDCKGATSPKVIACLQPDRRVDVEVVVSRKI